MNESEMMKYLCELASSRLTSEEHDTMAKKYEKLADHYDELAKEARTHAATHRALASDKR